jgi:CRP/FNR family transcriptional regulator, cyclic AMP receptor protein
MNKPIDPEDPNLKKYLRQISAGDYLFRQGESGNTMFVLLEGIVVIYHQDHNVERLVGTLRAGEMVGEKAVLNKSPYRRNFTAQAQVESVVMEVDFDAFKYLQTKMPDLLLTMVRILSSRLDESNQMVFVLQSTDEVDRVIKYLYFYCQNHSKKVPEGSELVLSSTDIHRAINVSEDRVEEILNELTAQRILVKKKGGYIISDENALFDQITTIRERTAS